MAPLTESEKSEIIRLLNTGQPMPEQWRYRLFPGGHRAQETGREYRLVYDGKLKREEVLAQTPAAPWQLVREFCNTGRSIFCLLVVEGVSPCCASSASPLQTLSAP
jgi:hypothetical protein